MKVKRLLIAALVAAVAVPALAQAPSTGSGEQQAPRKRRVRSERLRRGDMGTWLVRELERVLDLDKEQKAKVLSLYKEHRKRMREHFRRDLPKPGSEQRQQIAALRERLLEAAKAGEDEKVSRLQKQLDELTGVAKGRELRIRFYDEIEKILSTEQKKKFAQWRLLREAGLPPRFVGNLKLLDRALDQVPTLSEAQQNTIDALVERYKRQARALPRKNMRGRRALAETLAAEILETLTPSQKILFTDAVKKTRAGLKRDKAGRARRGSHRPGGGAER